MSTKNVNRHDYKLTAIGWIPKEWKCVKLGDLVSIVSGNSPSVYQPTEGGKYPFVKVDDMNLTYIWQDRARQYTDVAINAVPSDSILFAKRGAAIETNKVRIAKVPLTMDSNMMALVSHKIFHHYLYYQIVFKNLWKIADTSTIPQINNKHIIPLRIPLPSLVEQRRIAAILSTWDQAIDQTRRLWSNTIIQTGSIGCCRH